MDSWYFSDKGLHVVALLRLQPRCRESGFHPRKSSSFQLKAKEIKEIDMKVEKDMIELTILEASNNIKKY
jgi:hypothetical protein